MYVLMLSAARVLQQYASVTDVVVVVVMRAGVISSLPTRCLLRQ